jgi:hydrogenase 3 maturation protease
MPQIEKDLADWLSGSSRVVLAGIGNSIRTDDYVGLKIVESLRGKVPSSVLLLEAETVPENYLEDIEQFQPTHVLLIDAAYLGLEPGQTRLVSTQNIESFSATSTHLLPLHIFAEVVKETTKAKIALLLVEPASMEFGEGLTAPVQAAAQQLTKTLIRLLG